MLFLGENFFNHQNAVFLEHFGILLRGWIETRDIDFIFSLSIILQDLVRR